VSGLWSHAAYTAIAGAGIGYAATRHDRSHAHRIAVAVLLFLAAWSLHFLWNSPLIIESLPIDAAILALPLKGLPTLVLVLVLARVERRREATWFAAVVAEEVPRGVITPGELHLLGSQRTRRRARRAARDRGGPSARRLVARLQREQVALGMAHCRRVPHEALVEASRAKVHGTHSELARLGIPSAVPEAIGRTAPAGAAGYIALVLSAVSVVFWLLAPVALGVALVVRAGIRHRGLVPTPVRLAVGIAWTATALLGLTILLAIFA
jgi:protease PrsW